VAVASIDVRTGDPARMHRDPMSRKDGEDSKSKLSMLSDAGYRMSSVVNTCVASSCSTVKAFLACLLCNLALESFPIASIKCRASALRRSMSPLHPCTRYSALRATATWRLDSLTAWLACEAGGPGSPSLNTSWGLQDCDEGVDGNCTSLLRDDGLRP